MRAGATNGVRRRVGSSISTAGNRGASWVVLMSCLVSGSVASLAATGAAAQDETFAIVGGTVHTLAGPPMMGATVVIENGRIVGVGTSTPAGAIVIDASGLHVYPGMCNAFSRIGLQEINAVAVTNDFTEAGDFNPHIAAATAVHPSSERIPVTRANGVTHAVAAPAARPGGIGGQASAIHLDGWTVEEMLIAQSVGFVMSWPSIQTRQCTPFGCFGPSGPFGEAEQRFEEAVDQIRGWLTEARRYRQAAEGGISVRRDLKLEALGVALSGELPLLVLADQARDIRNLVAFAEEEGLRVVVVSGRDAWQEAELLAEKDVPVLLRATQNVPDGDDDDYHTTFSAAARLYEAGVRFAMTAWASAGPNPPGRTLPYEAANAVPFGLPAEEALKAITRYPAEILGLGDDLGTIEVGKIGNVIVTDGDPLQIRTQMLHVFINGRPSSLLNKHQALYEKYRARR